MICAHRQVYVSKTFQTESREGGRRALGQRGEGRISSRSARLGGAVEVPRSPGRAPETTAIPSFIFAHTDCVVIRLDLWWGRTVRQPSRARSHQHQLPPAGFAAFPYLGRAGLALLHLIITESAGRLPTEFQRKLARAGKCGCMPGETTRAGAVHLVMALRPSSLLDRVEFVPVEPEIDGWATANLVRPVGCNEPLAQGFRAALDNGAAGPTSAQAQLVNALSSRTRLMRKYLVAIYTPRLFRKFCCEAVPEARSQRRTRMDLRLHRANTEGQPSWQHP